MIIVDSATCTTHHAAPLCDGFSQAVKESGGRPAGPAPFCCACRRSDVELRLYGKGGLPICARCVTSSPERQREARRQMRRALRRAGSIPVIVDGVGIISMEEAERLGLGESLQYIDTKTGRVIPRGKG